MKEGTLLTDITEIKMILREYYKQLYTNKLGNLAETNKLLQTHNVQRLSHK